MAALEPGTDSDNDDNNNNNGDNDDDNDEDIDILSTDESIISMGQNNSMLMIK